LKKQSPILRAAHFTFISLLLGLTSTACGGTVDPSDREVGSVLSGEIDPWGVFSVLVGQITVVNADSLTEGQISATELEDLEAWSKAGLVSLTSENVPSASQSFDWTDWFTRANGHPKSLTVTPTPDGLRFQSRTRLSPAAEASLRLPRLRSPEILYGRFFTVRLERIVENNEIQTTTDKLRLVKGVLSQQWNETGEAVYRAGAWPMPHQKKFATLLEYDPFHDSWRSVAWDMADFDKPFTSHNVDTALSSRTR
jgi:hypothetical protein